MQSDRRLLRWYNLIRKKFFRGKELPLSVCVRWADPYQDEIPNDTIGWADLAQDKHHIYEIVLVKEHHPNPATTLLTLVHEMIHVANGLSDGHGPAFEKWIGILKDRGIFRKGAIRKGCTLL